MIKLLQIARPQFLISGLALFVFGASWAILLGAPFSLSKILLGDLVLMRAHISISYSNDYLMWKSTSTINRPFSAEALAVELKEKLNITKLEVKRISPVLGVRTGPGIVGTGIVPMELMSDLVK